MIYEISCKNQLLEDLSLFIRGSHIIILRFSLKQPFLVIICLYQFELIMTEYKSNQKVVEKQQKSVEPGHNLIFEKQEVDSKIIKRMKKEEQNVQVDDQQNEQENQPTPSKIKHYVQEGDSSQNSDAEGPNDPNDQVGQLEEKVKKLQKQVEELRQNYNTLQTSSQAQLKKKQDEIKRLKSKQNSQKNQDNKLEEEKPSKENDASQRDRLIKGLTVLVQKNQENTRQIQGHIRQLELQRLQKQQELNLSEQRIAELNSQKQLLQRTLQHYESQTQALQVQKVHNLFKALSQMNELERKHTSMAQKLSRTHSEIQDELRQEMETKEQRWKQLERLKMDLKGENTALKKQRQHYINEIASLSERLAEQRLLRMETPQKECPKRRRFTAPRKIRKNKDKWIWETYSQKFIPEQLEQDPLSQNEEST